MRIAFDAKRLYNNFTGLGNHSRTTIDILREFYPETECLLFTPHIKESAVTSSYLDRDGCRTIMPHGVVRGGLWRTFFMSSDIRKEKPDIFHGLSNELPAGLDIPSAVTIHDVAFRTFKDMYHWNDRITYDLKWKHACHRADRIIAISESTRKDIISFYNADPDKVCTVYQPVSRLFYSDGGEKRPDFLTEDFPYMLYVGSINSRKNLMGIVKAMELLPSDLRIPLIAIGDGRRYKQEVLEYVSSRNLERSIILPGQKVDMQELKYLYSHARLFVYPSFYEGFGLPVVEAMLCRCPVITSNVSSLPEAAGPHSLTVNPGSIEEISDCMARVLADGELRSGMADRSHEYAMNRFHPRKLAGDLMDIYIKMR